eukprot:GEMP01004521.1.p1 GENE.GEMP01004521.1~~GEMP01004521.1.p1  ORF type:complete len:1002 (+),score=226.64 GEMP01004521.1:240-3245(+)
METLSRVICDLHRDLKDIKKSIPQRGGGPCPAATWDLLNTKIGQAEKVLKARAAEAIGAADKRTRKQNKQPEIPPLDYQQAREKYNVHTPTSTRRPKIETRPSSRVRKTRTTGPRRLLPRLNRNDPMADTPLLNEADLDEGLFRLVNKGLVPQTADLTPAFQRGVPCMMHGQVPFYLPSDKRLLRQSVQPQAYPVKLDLNVPDYLPPKSAPYTKHVHQQQYLPPIPQTAPSPMPLYGCDENIFCTEVMDDDQLCREIRCRTPSPVRETQLAASRLKGDLLVRYGALFTDLDRLRESFDSNWDTVEWMLGRLLHILREMPAAHIITDRMVSLLSRNIAYLPSGVLKDRIPKYLNISDVDLIDCVRDGEDAVIQCQHLVPGLRFLLGDRKSTAATYIAASWKMIVRKREFVHIKARNEAARSIQRYWKFIKQLWATRDLILARQEERQKAFRRLQFSFAQGWDDIHGNRVEIHVCSTSIDEFRRGILDNYQARQSQLGRIFRAACANCDIIYVAPQELHRDLIDYFFKVMQFRGLDSPESRIQFVVPENLPGCGLPAHMSLTYALLYSPLALKRIRALLTNQKHRAMFVFGSGITAAEVDLAVQFDVPIYGCDPKNVDLLCTKSAHKRVLTMADIRMPPQASDIYDAEELFAQLASLTVAHPDVGQWLVKLDDEAAGRGTAVWDPRGVFVDSEELDTVQQALRRQVPKRIVLPRAYDSWAAFSAQIALVGCIVQAMPDDIESYPSIHCRIDPNANVHILGTSEQLIAQSMETIAAFYPQMSVPQVVTDDIGYRVCRTLASKGVCGFVTIDLVCFYNPDYRESDSEIGDEPVMIGGEIPEDQRFFNMESPSPELSDNGSVGNPNFTQLPPSRQRRILDCLDKQMEAKKGGNLEYLRGMHRNSVRNPFSKTVWVVDIDYGISQTMSMLWPMEFVGQLERTQDGSGSYGLAAHAPTYKLGQKQERVGLALPLSLCPAFETMNCQTAFQMRSRMASPTTFGLMWEPS